MRTSLTVEFAKLSDEAKLPTQGSPQAAGWDLYALEETIVERRKSSMIKTGLAVAIPEGWEGQIRCRSSLGKKGMIMPNGIGTIDSDYRGEIKAIIINHGRDKYTVKRGDRIAQIIFSPIARAKIKSVSKLSETIRGEGGFGSTGIRE